LRKDVADVSMMSASRGWQAERGQKRRWAVGGPADSFQLEKGFRPKKNQATQPFFKSSEVWISPSSFLLHWADDLLGKLTGLKAQTQPAAHSQVNTSSGKIAHQVLDEMSRPTRGHAARPCAGVRSVRRRRPFASLGCERSGRLRVPLLVGRPSQAPARGKGADGAT
jgi:hypothetical protein